MPLFVLPLAAVPLAWLLPDHYHPWLSAWQEGLAIALLCLAALLHRHGNGKMPMAWTAAIATVLASVGLQAAVGPILFGGDAWLVALYLLALAIAITLGSTLPALPTTRGGSALDWIAAATVGAACASVAVALMQWTGTDALPFPVVGVRPGGRPAGNVAQANHLCSLLFLGLCSLALLCESGRVGRSVFWLCAAFLLGGMVMSGSRTGWLEVGLLLPLVYCTRRRLRARVGTPQVLALLGLYAAATLLWPWLNDALLLAAGRGVGDQLQGGVRLPLWSALLDAVARAPLAGWGWQQVARAQHAVALDHPPVLHLFEHSHNLVLDLLLWAGVPVGGTIAALGGWATWAQLRALRDPRALWLMAGVLGLLAHAMLEYPLEYAYFMVPAGVALGAAHALGSGGRAWTVSSRHLRVAGFVAAALLGSIAFEYLQAEENHRQLRLESARIGAQSVNARVPDLTLLSQLRVFLTFARTEARPGMSADELDGMRKVAERYGYPPVLFRHAAALALNGRPQQAQTELARLCSMHLPVRCAEGREAWTALQSRYPQIAGTAFP